MAGRCGRALVLLLLLSELSQQRSGSSEAPRVSSNTFSWCRQGVEEPFVLGSSLSSHAAVCGPRLNKSPWLLLSGSGFSQKVSSEDEEVKWGRELGDFPHLARDCLQTRW